MKKYLVLVLMFLGTLSYALDRHVSYVPWDVDGFKMYYIAAGTETAASYTRKENTIALTVTGGNQSGTTSYATTGVADYDTFAEFKSWVESHDSSSTAVNLYLTNPCMQGKWVITIPEDVYKDYPMTALDLVNVSSDCFGGGSAEKQLALYSSSVTVLSYYLPVSGYQRPTIENVIANVTTAGTPTFTIYSGTVQKYPNITLTSASPIYIGNMSNESPVYYGYTQSTPEVRVSATAAMTAGYLIVNWITE